MSKREKIQLFEGMKVRTAWDEEREKWYFSIVDVCGVLIDQPDYQKARKYWNKLKQRLVEEGFQPVTNCHQLKLIAQDGKPRLTDVADAEQLFRIIQSIPSPKAEPFKQWLARVGYERVTTEVSQKEKPEGMRENVKVAKRGGSVAGVARKAAEKEIGHSVVSQRNFLDKNPDNILIGGVDEE